MMNLKNIKRPNFPFLYYRLFFFYLKLIILSVITKKKTIIQSSGIAFINMNSKIEKNNELADKLVGK
jgi:hypothetical protein